jgi:hypothetical protein
MRGRDEGERRGGEELMPTPGPCSPLRGSARPAPPKSRFALREGC